MNRLINKALHRNWKWLYYKVFALRLRFYKMNDDYDKVNRIKHEPAQFHSL